MRSASSRSVWGAGHSSRSRKLVMPRQNALWSLLFAALAALACSGDYVSPTAPLEPPPLTTEPPSEPVDFDFPPPAGSVAYQGSITIRGANPVRDCVAKAANADVGKQWTARLILPHELGDITRGTLEAPLFFGPHTLCNVRAVRSAKGLRVEMDAYCGMDALFEYGKSCATKPFGWFYPGEADLPLPRNGSFHGTAKFTIGESRDTQREIGLSVSVDLEAQP
jgi:hypothetical protein